MHHFEEVRSVPIKDKYDVIVIGGGIAGVSAALAARRSGARVLIVEKSIALGGLATSGLIVFYLCALCDGYGRKIMSGIAEELLHLSIKYGYSGRYREEQGRAGRLPGSHVRRRFRRRRSDEARWSSMRGRQQLADVLGVFYEFCEDGGSCGGRRHLPRLEARSPWLDPNRTQASRWVEAVYD